MKTRHLFSFAKVNGCWQATSKTLPNWYVEFKDFDHRDTAILTALGRDFGGKWTNTTANDGFMEMFSELKAEVEALRKEVRRMKEPDDK